MILLDQRVRLLEMIQSFQQSAEDIDQLFNNKVSQAESSRGLEDLSGEDAEMVVTSSLWEDDMPGAARGVEGGAVPG